MPLAHKRVMLEHRNAVLENTLNDLKFVIFKAKFVYVSPLCSEDGSSRFHRNVFTYLRNYIAPLPSITLEFHWLISVQC
jgi:hypothetical protein